jgi:DNA polymerase epsilon subunit 3
MYSRLQDYWCFLSGKAESNVASAQNHPTNKLIHIPSSCQDLLLPRTLTSRLARGVLPANTSIQKDALLALTKAATVFISYLAHNANELTSKKTVGPQDVLKAIQEIEMDGIMGLGALGTDGKVGGRLERELEVFENVVRGKRKGYREKVKARESGASIVGGGGKGGVDGDEGGERQTKRARYEDDEEGQHDTRQNGPGGETATTARTQPPTRQYYHHQHSATMGPPSSGPATNGATPHLPNDDTLPDDDLDDEHEDNADDEEVDDARSEEDDVDQEEEGEEGEDDERQAEEDDLDGYGPDDQLRHDMNNGEDDESRDDSD